MLMICATIFIACGYLCIFMAHSPMSQLFGYDFKTEEWKPWKRIVHVYMGYASLALVIFQVCIGATKYRWLQMGYYKFRFHGDVGKITYVMGIGTMCAGVVIMTAWSTMARLLICFLIVSLLILFGIAKQFPVDATESAKSGDESEELSYPISVMGA